ncbi:MAG: iron ABC transporter permease, partial [Muribaculaceae bacterium]|nr:iron ABC transporter permease [Muribaculaceae bacterium]
AGLLLQTTFNNPLAGPSILGVSTGASLGVALTLLAGFGAGAGIGAAALIGSTMGAIVIILVLLALSAVVRSSMMLLIVGILLSYLTSSGISILNFFATQEGVHSYVIWGLGSFSGVGRDGLTLFTFTVAISLFLALLLVKPLNALLLGERYASNLGVNVTAARTMILLVSGILTAVVTSFCGPVSFIGLAVPHIARLALNTSNHRRLLPATMLAGASTGLLTLLIASGVFDTGSLPVNAITPIIGVPVVLYIILNRRRLNYFN